MIPVIIATVIGVNVGLTASFHRIFYLSVLAQLSIAGFGALADLRGFPVSSLLLLGAFVLQLINGVLLLRAGLGGKPVPWPLVRALFTTAAGVVVLRTVIVAWQPLTRGDLFSVLILTVMFLVPSVGQIALLWWPRRMEPVQSRASE